MKRDVDRRVKCGEIGVGPVRLLLQTTLKTLKTRSSASDHHPGLQPEQRPIAASNHEELGG